LEWAASNGSRRFLFQNPCTDTGTWGIRSFIPNEKTTALVVLPAGGGLIYFECSELGGGDLAQIELRIGEREHFVPDGE
jgi:hypothetical protein